MLKDILEQKKCFKLVCGAGNEDAIEVEKLVTLYAKAGCHYFDLCAKPEIVDAAKKGLKNAGNLADKYLGISVGIKGDPHVSKAFINEENCVGCEICTKNCLQNAIIKKGEACEIATYRCIGCGKCSKVCPKNCIEMKSEFKNLKEILPPLVEKGLDAIEFHALGEDEVEVDEKWADINNLFDGILSICVDRSKLGNEKLLQRVKRMIDTRKPYTTIIQADGAPMSGGSDDFKTTLQTIATAEIFQNENWEVFIILSGGTNSKSTQAAKLFDIYPHGVAIGSYARKIVREYIDREDFLENEEVFNKALKIAKNLVDASLEYMG